MRRCHRMPFGAEWAEDATRFRLWAPSAKRVDVELSQGEVRSCRPLQAVGDGWYEARIAGVASGARYAYRIDDTTTVPDPASRFNPEDVYAPNAVVNPLEFDWPDENWRGRPWHEAVIYELHVGTFSAAGTFAGVIERLDYLADLGVTALELMPIAEFPGRHNWGYDGVLPFAPDAAYGTPEDLKRLVACAHAHGLMVILDVVYNHFGPEGNYLALYAAQFFNPEHRTPWGDAINFDADRSRTVRDFFIHNALYWLEEYHVDGLRLDAVHAIEDPSQPDVVEELIGCVRDGPGRSRHVHIVLENDANESRYLGRDPQRDALRANAQWNDDMHHAVHVLVTGEVDGYYADYALRPHWLAARALAEGFGYQGEASSYRAGLPRGTSSSHLHPTAFVNFLQSHDQVGNRAHGERLHNLAAHDPLHLAIACLLLAPAIPMLFMGEEFGADTPFLFFCDFAPELAGRVREGRASEFARFARFTDHAARASIPDPNLAETFLACKLAWHRLEEAAPRAWHTLYRRLLELRRRYIVPLLDARLTGGRFALLGESGISVDWQLAAGETLHLRANFSADRLEPVKAQAGRLLYATHPQSPPGALPAWAGVWTLAARRE